MNRSMRLQVQASDLPNGARCVLGRMIPNERTQFPEDRAFQDRQNRREFVAKAATAAFFRRTIMPIAALGGEELEVEYGRA